MKIILLISATFFFASGCKFNCSCEFTPNNKQFILVPMGEDSPPAPSFRPPDVRAEIK